jgi:hypothetical protein
MLTRFVSDSAWGAPDYIYPYDDTVNVKSTKLNVAGNLNTVYAPFLQGLNDFSNNNYSVFFLTNKQTLSSFIETKQPASYSLENGYPCILGTFLEGDLIKEDSLFLECIPLYNHANEFEINFRSFFNSCTSLSGGSLLFTLLDPVLTGVEVGFSINGEPPLYSSASSIKRTVNINNNTSMFGAAAALSSSIENLNFCRFLSSSDINEYGNNQTFSLIISSKDGTPLSGETVRGYSFTLWNTELGYLPETIPDLDIREFIFSLGVSGYPALYPPGTTDENNAVILPRNNLFSRNASSETITRALTSIFDPTISAPYPSSEFFGLQNYTYTQSSIQLNIFNRLSGYPIMEPQIFNGYNTNFNDFRINVTKKGISAGFRLMFGRNINPTDTELQLPKFYDANNTSFSVSALSLLNVNQFNNFLLYSYKPNFVTLFGNNNRIFLDFNIVDDKQIFITHTLYRRKAFLVSDDLNKDLFFVDSSNMDETNLRVALFNYVYDPERKKIIIYRNIDGNMYALGVRGASLVYQLIDDLGNMDSSAVFNLFSFIDIKTLFEKNGWVSYSRSPNPNNLNIDPSKSFDVDNNFLFHAEYSNSDSNLHINLLPLKNQLNELNLQNRVKDGVNFRDYHSLYTGDNSERGTASISLGYIAKTKEYVFKSGNITWFHMPYNENFKRININEANFVKNGAIPGGSPVFSDKIWKKAGSYKYTSNLGDSITEQTGQWLCAWLSGGNDGGDAIWVDRFYNPDILTPLEAVKVTNNNEYIPTYAAKNYAQGITDRPSTLTLEPGVWYAYNHIGKNDANAVIDFIKKDIIQEGLIDFGPLDGSLYKFAGRQSGYISIKDYKTPLNIFSLSFFGYSDNWSKPLGNQIIGNYLDSGFGIFNFQEINPITYYFSKNTLTTYNIENGKISSLTLSSNVSGNIFGLFRRNFYENYHVITDLYEILEYTIDGTLVDFVSPAELHPGFNQFNIKEVLSVSNNLTKGVILFADLSYSVVDLKTNIIKHFPDSSSLIPVNIESLTQGIKFNIYIDNNDNIYLVNGRCPIIRQNKLYFIDYNQARKVYVFDTSNNTINEYVDTSVIESLPESPSFTLSFANEDQVISRGPLYRNFNLASLSGMGVTLYPHNDQPYRLGFSIYRDPYIIEGEQREYTQLPGQNSEILVDLNGNHWYKADAINRERLEEIYYSDSIGWSNNIGENGLVLIGDPAYREQYASQKTYGKVFAFNVENQNLQPIGSIDLGAKPQITELVFSVNQTTPQTTLSDLISSFPLSSSIIFANGSDILNTEYNSISALSLAFKINDSIPVHNNVSIPNKVVYTFTQPITSMSLLVNQLSSSFSLNNIPYQAGFVSLSTFFNFSVTELTETGFIIRAENKPQYGGPTLIPFSFNSSNPLVATTNLSYSAVNVLAGEPGTGIDGQEFGWQIQTKNVFDEPTGTTADYLFVSSPGINRVTLYKNLIFDRVSNRTSFLTAINYNSPAGNNIRYGHSFDTLFITEPAEEGIFQSLGLVIGSQGQSDFAFTSAYYYELFSSTYERIPLYTLAGRTSAGWGHKVGLGKYFIAISAPLSSSSHRGQQVGGISIFGYVSGNRVPNNFEYIEHLGPPTGQSRYRFGHSFDIDDNFFAVASLSGGGNYGGVTVDVFQRKNLNINTQTQFNILSTLSFPFINNESNIHDLLSSVNIDVKLYKNYLTVGAWRGDEEALGDEHSKIVVWEINKNAFYKVYEYSNRNTDDGVFKTYAGRSVDMVVDRLATGTMFIYNTGNSLSYAVSSINSAIKSQTNGRVDGQTIYVDNNNFSTTFTTLISATDQQPPILYTGVPAVTTLNVFKIQNYLPGSPLLYSGDIINFAFDLSEETKVFTDYNKIKTFDVLGNYKSTLLLNDYGLPITFSGIRYGLNNIYNLGQVLENSSIIAIDNLNQIYKINFNEKQNDLSYELIDTEPGSFNIFLPTTPDYSNITRRTFDITNCGLMESSIRPQDVTPSLTFKIRLNNRLDFEEALILEPVYFTENLNKGWHHFAVVFDSVKGTYSGYIDARQIFTYNFDPGKYTYSQILKNNLLVGTVPFYNGIPFNNFYKGSLSFFNITNITLDNIKFYNRALHKEEVKFLSYEKHEPEDLRFQLEYGERNYIDTIDRVSRHKMPGRKSQYIDIVINDSLIDDKDLQSYYETKIITELRDYLPTYVKINKIVWKDNSSTRESIRIKDINIGNTLTNSGGVVE